MMYENQLANAAAQVPGGLGHGGFSSGTMNTAPPRAPATFASLRDRLDIVAARLQEIRSGCREQIDRLIGAQPAPAMSSAKGETSDKPISELARLDATVFVIENTIDGLENQLARLANA